MSVIFIMFISPYLSARLMKFGIVDILKYVNKIQFCLQSEMSGTLCEHLGVFYCYG